jgi:hypothetical protein
MKTTLNDMEIARRGMYTAEAAEGPAIDEVRRRLLSRVMVIIVRDQGEEDKTFLHTLNILLMFMIEYMACGPGSPMLLLL